MRKSQTGLIVAACLGVLVLGACNLLKVSQPADDKAIVAEIQSKLFQDAVLKQRDVRVSSEKGVVVVAGTVNTELEKAAALRLAGETKGVRQVIDQLSVAPATAVTPAAPEAALSATEPLPATAAARPEPKRPSRRTAGTSAARKPAAESPAVAQAPTATAPAESTAPAATPPTTALDTAAQPTRQAEQITIPEGTVITVRMIDSIDSSRNRVGEEFAASVDAPVAVGERVVIPRGSDARVRLAEVRSAGRMTGQSELQIELVSVTVGGASYTATTDLYQKRGASRGTRTAQTVGGGAALGALIGAIAGHGKGAAIGAAVGAGAGTAVQVATRGQQVKVPSETKLDFTLKQPLTVTM